MQNDLGEVKLNENKTKFVIDLSAVEFYSMADFTNPGILGTIDHFRKHFQSPILNGREPDAPEPVREKGQLAQVYMLMLCSKL